MAASVELCAVASGSNGNCYYIGDSTEAVLIDAGLSARALQTRLQQSGLSATPIRGIVISHEHCDHSRGVRVFAKRLQIPVYLTKQTYLAMARKERPAEVIWFAPDVPFMLGALQIYPFLKQHDAAEPCSFRIVCNGFSIGVFTDIGAPCSQVKAHFAQCHAAFLETNYDEQMLESGPYPAFLKSRIASANGHLSNSQAFHLLQSCAGPNLSTILLSHLSGENNTPEKALATFGPMSRAYRIELAPRTAPSPIVRIE
ncbi:MAG: MBL fold metallo-hydrolase [Bacteroidales bacterium]|jgi:phosphoribosyl 1,2-cyclic phosphodiesterase|nr:MBL fold metallo-hydrolase [Bacteroidales bacterium]